MNRFKIIGKQILPYRDGGLPTQLEMEFRTWDDRSAISGLGLRANPGNITHLSVSGRTLDESTGILGDPGEKEGSDDLVEVNIGPPDEDPVGGGLGGGSRGGTIFVLTG